MPSKDEICVGGGDLDFDKARLFRAQLLARHVSDLFNANSYYDIRPCNEMANEDPEGLLRSAS